MKNRVSDNVGSVKHSWSALARALRRVPKRVFVSHFFNLYHEDSLQSRPEGELDGESVFNDEAVEKGT